MGNGVQGIYLFSGVLVERGEDGLGERTEVFNVSSYQDVTPYDDGKLTPVENHRIRDVRVNRVKIEPSLVTYTSPMSLEIPD